MLTIKIIQNDRNNPPGKPAVYLIFTRSYGILQKTDVTIKAARAWAARALPDEVTQVLRTTASVNVAELEAEWRVLRQPTSDRGLSGGHR